MERGHLTEQSDLGRITIAADAIAQIVGHTAAECYGVVGMAGKGLRGSNVMMPRRRGALGGARQGRRERRYAGISARLRTPHRAAQRASATQGFIALEPLKRLLTRDKLTQGIAVSGSGEGLRVDLHVVVEYGLNLAEVAATVRSRVAYEVERLTGLTVAAVEVHIDDVRRSA